MFILTQNQTGVADTSKCFGIHIVDESTVIRAYTFDGDGWMKLGKYKTVERAKEVVQEINTALCEHRVSFDMPED